ncbi:MAG TPA: arsenite methyltransferase [Thermoanaerobaculia bacterium]|nr:arsenite methyltransferase [Thermoanaerobaculia bacterium]
MNTSEIHETVRNHYARAAQGAGCCSTSAAPQSEACGTKYYDEKEILSLGCGNPHALLELKEGEVVLDLGSGAGLDVILSARRVGSTGKAYGLDMTDEMLALARRNAQEAGVANVEFLRGNIENIPLPNETVDVVISNCVINLSPDKDRVLAEAFRVLKPGGRFAVYDIVTAVPMSDELRSQADAWCGCVSGAMTTDEYASRLKNAGFRDVNVDVTHKFEDETLKAKTEVQSAFVRATK